MKTFSEYKIIAKHEVEDSIFLTGLFVMLLLLLRWRESVKWSVEMEKIVEMMRMNNKYK